jgi:hypothetical protein
MELAGLLGRYGGSEGENTRAIRDTFARSAAAANEYGYSAGEGMEAVKQGAAQGLGEGEAITAAKKAFAFERGTGADRNALLELETRGRRFGMDNMIGAAWQGSQASGMAPGQFNEFLRSMQRVFEDGISKGFVRGGQEIAGNLAYLSGMSGGNPLYQGERGAQVLSQLNNGLAGAVELNSVNDILTYRAAQQTWDELSDKEKEEIYTSAGMTRDDMKNGTDWLNASMLLERGFRPELFKAQMRMFETAERGDTENIVERMSQQYDLSKTGAFALLQMYRRNGSAGMEDFERVRTLGSSAPASGSEELNYAKLTQSFAAELAEFGQTEFSVKVTKLPELIDKEREKLYGEPETPPEAYPVRLPEYTEQAALDQANMENLSKRAKKDSAGFFSTGFFFKSAEQNADTDAERQFNNILNDAVISRDEAQVQQAAAVLDILKAGPEKTRKEWDRDNTLNTALAGSKGIEDLLRRLVALEEENKRIQVTVSAGTED